MVMKETEKEKHKGKERKEKQMREKGGANERYRAREVCTRRRTEGKTRGWLWYKRWKNRGKMGKKEGKKIKRVVLRDGREAGETDGEGTVLR